MEIKTRDFLFIDNEIMGEFFVECETLQEAWETIYQEYGQNSDIEYTGMIFTPAEAEAIGYDTL